MFKNVASQKLAVFAYDNATRAPKTGDAANITAQISKDGGACSASNDVNPTELDAANAKGIYIFNLTQAETNADMIAFSAVSSTANITLEPIMLHTALTVAAIQADLASSLEVAIVGTSVVTAQVAINQIIAAVITNAAGADIAADIATVKVLAEVILQDTDELQIDNIPALIATAQADLDILTGADGVTLATSQPNYAPAIAGDAMDLVTDALDADAVKADAVTEIAAGVDVTAVKLASDGLDSVVVAEPSGDPDGWSFAKKLCWLCMRFLNKHTSDNFNGIQVYKADDTVSTTQTVTDANGVKTVGKATL